MKTYTAQDHTTFEKINALQLAGYPLAAEGALKAWINSMPERNAEIDEIAHRSNPKWAELYAHERREASRESRRKNDYYDERMGRDSR